MFGDLKADRENVTGARWNPPEVPAIYVSLERDTALAEGEYLIRAQPLRPRAPRHLFTIEVKLSSVLDLSTRDAMEQLELFEKDFALTEYARCQEVGGTVAWMDHDGLLVPSARCAGRNLVIFPNCGKGDDYLFRVTSDEAVTDNESE